MSGGRVERRLAAVLAADIAGYSRLMGADELGTLAALKAHRREVVDPAIAGHNGRIVKTTGDGILAEFASAVDAVTCAMVVQAKMAERRGSFTPTMTFRIGINIGDIIIDGDDIFGDGVNVAARVENECGPGGVCLSGSAYEQVRGKTPFTFDDLGERSLKNIDWPVRLYAARIAAELVASVSPQPEVTKPLALPDRPSIAVLPFQNMSGDPEQEYFADGMVEDIITALSQFKSLFVIARNSSFTYKGKAVDIKQVGRELGVRYVLEGSVRRAGGRVRITGQLVEAATGSHLWAERFDGAIADVFELQDAVTERVVGAIEPFINQAEINRARAKPTGNLDAYDYYLRALQQVALYTRDGAALAMDNACQAISLDPNYALAKAMISNVYMLRWIQGWGEPGDPEKGLSSAREAIALDSSDPTVLRLAGTPLGFWGDHDRSIALLEKAASLNVNGALIQSGLGWVRNYACSDTDRAIAHFERSMRLSPRAPEMPGTLTGIGFAHLIAGHYEEALAFAQKAIDDGPQFTSGHRVKIASLVFLSRSHEAKAAAAALLGYDPTFAISSRLPVYRDVNFRQRYFSALEAAGLR